MIDQLAHHQLVSSVGRAPDYHGGGSLILRSLILRRMPSQCHLKMVKDILVFSDKDDKL